MLQECVISNSTKAVRSLDGDINLQSSAYSNTGHELQGTAIAISSIAASRGIGAVEESKLGSLRKVRISKSQSVLLLYKSRGHSSPLDLDLEDWKGLMTANKVPVCCGWTDGGDSGSK